ncbi:unnamed protein product [Polarella glacialis]|uniref:Uncharacterized protein n=1 Tax=Polarella glacialis TaxID=89957 RepID=A0A813FNN4_POLGL|nr:unnamed protein product [Polarella glacialis]
MQLTRYLSSPATWGPVLALSCKPWLCRYSQPFSLLLPGRGAASVIAAAPQEAPQSSVSLLSSASRAFRQQTKALRIPTYSSYSFECVGSIRQSRDHTAHSFKCVAKEWMSCRHRSLATSSHQSMPMPVLHGFAQKGDVPRLSPNKEAECCTWHPLPVQLISSARPVEQTGPIRARLRLCTRDKPYCRHLESWEASGNVLVQQLLVLPSLSRLPCTPGARASSTVFLDRSRVHLSLACHRNPWFSFVAAGDYKGCPVQAPQVPARALKSASPAPTGLRRASPEVSTSPEAISNNSAIAARLGESLASGGLPVLLSVPLHVEVELRGHQEQPNYSSARGGGLPSAKLQAVEAVGRATSLRATRCCLHIIAAAIRPEVQVLPPQLLVQTIDRRRLQAQSCTYHAFQTLMSRLQNYPCQRACPVCGGASPRGARPALQLISFHKTRVLGSSSRKFLASSHTCSLSYATLPAHCACPVPILGFRGHNNNIFPLLQEHFRKVGSTASAASAVALLCTPQKSFDGFLHRNTQEWSHHASTLVPPTKNSLSTKHDPIGHASLLRRRPFAKQCGRAVVCTWSPNLAPMGVLGTSRVVHTAYLSLSRALCCSAAARNRSAACDFGSNFSLAALQTIRSPSLAKLPSSRINTIPGEADNSSARWTLPHVHCARLSALACLLGTVLRDQSPKEGMQRLGRSQGLHVGYRPTCRPLLVRAEEFWSPPSTDSLCAAGVSLRAKQQTNPVPTRLSPCNWKVGGNSFCFISFATLFAHRRHPCVFATLTES